MPEILLTPGQFLGLSDIAQSPSIQYYGDMRAHMTPVKTYKVLQADLERVMNYPELAKVRQTDYTLPQYKLSLTAIAS